MKKLLAIGTVAIMMLGATSPASAQAIITDNGDDGNLTVEYYDASQFQGAAALQVNEGSANAAADNGSTADASIDQGLYIDQYQLNGGFGDGVWNWY